MQVVLVCAYYTESSDGYSYWGLWQGDVFTSPGQYLGMKNLGHIVTQCETLQHIGKVVCKAAAALSMRQSYGYSLFWTTAIIQLSKFVKYKDDTSLNFNLSFFLNNNANHLNVFVSEQLLRGHIWSHIFARFVMSYLPYNIRILNIFWT